MDVAYKCTLQRDVWYSFYMFFNNIIGPVILTLCVCACVCVSVWSLWSFYLLLLIVYEEEQRFSNAKHMNKSMRMFVVCQASQPPHIQYNFMNEWIKTKNICSSMRIVETKYMLYLVYTSTEKTVCESIQTNNEHFATARVVEQLDAQAAYMHRMPMCGWRDFFCDCV